MGKNSLGELIVTISTDLSKFNSGLKDAESGIKKASAEIIKTTEKVSKGLLVMGGVISGAFALMVKSSVDYGDQIYEVSQRTGIAVETLSKLKFVAEQTESSFEAVATGLRFLNRNIAEAVDGNNKMSLTLQRAGVILRDDVTGEIISADKAFLQIADRFKNLNDNALKTNIAMEIFGRGGAELIPVLNLGSDGIQKLSEEAKRLGLVLSKDNAVAIDQFSDDMGALKASVGGLWLSLSVLIIPVLNEFTNKIKDTIINIREWTEKNPQLSNTLAEFVLVAGTMSIALGTLGLAVANVLKGLNVLYTLLINMNPVAKTFGAIIAGWTFGSFIAEIPQVKEGLSGPEGIFTKIFKFADSPKLSKLKEMVDWFVKLGLTGIGIKVQEPKISEPKPKDEPVQEPIQLEPITVSPAVPTTVDMEREQSPIEIETALIEENLNKQEELKEQAMFADSTRRRKQIAESYAQETSIFNFKKRLGVLWENAERNHERTRQMIRQQSYDQFVSLLEQAAEESKTAAVLLKAVRIGEAIVNTATGVTQALAAYPPPFSIVMAGLVTALGSAQIALISGVKFASGTDTVPSMLSPGETVIPRSFADAIRQGKLTLSGPGAATARENNPININISDVTINSDYDIENLAEQLGTNIQKKIRSR